MDRDDYLSTFSVRAVRPCRFRDRRRGPEPWGPHDPDRPAPPDLPASGTDGRLADDDLAAAIQRAGVVALLGLPSRDRRACLLAVLGDADDAKAAAAVDRLAPGLAKW